MLRAVTQEDLRFNDVLPNIKAVFDIEVWRARRRASPAKFRELADFIENLPHGRFGFDSWICSPPDYAGVEISEEEYSETVKKEGYEDLFLEAVWMRHFVQSPKVSERIMAAQRLGACGTTACVGGWATAFPWAKEDGFHLMLGQEYSRKGTRLDFESVIVVEYLGQPIALDLAGTYELQYFFGLTSGEVSWLFVEPEEIDIKKTFVDECLPGQTLLPIRMSGGIRADVSDIPSVYVVRNLRAAAKWLEEHPEASFVEGHRDTHLIYTLVLEVAD